ncbi:MAG: response regulator [Deltaproteobacteria bacterium]|nr:response regulator [Deltaproteobacteria bacterium]
MKTLIVEDEYAARAMLEFFMGNHGKVDISENGKTAISLFEKSLKSNSRYDLICLDIKLPDTDGHSILTSIKKMEEKYNIPRELRSVIFMTSALEDPKTVSKAFYNLCDEYLSKPVKKDELDRLLSTYHLI